MILPFYSIVNIIIYFDSQNELTVNTTIIKDNNRNNLENRKFFLENGKISATMQKYINNFFSKYHYVYLCVVLNAKYQIAIPKCDKKILNQLNIAVGKLISLCIDDRYLVCAYKDDINTVETIFKPIGIDFIISPIVIFDHICKNLQRANLEIILYAFFCDNYMIVTIYKDKEMLFNRYTDVNLSLPMDIAQDNGDTIIDDEDDEFALDIDYSLEEDEKQLEPMEELQDIDDNVDDLDSFENSDNLDNIKMLLINFIENSINDFYENKIYKNSDFVSEIIIMSDGINLDSICKFVEGSLFMDTSYQQINLTEAINSILEKEVDNV